MLEEKTGAVTFYDIHHIAEKYKIKQLRPLDQILNKLRRNGFLAERTHFQPTAIKTNAEINDIVKVL